MMWQTDHIDCQRVADLAGAKYDAETVGTGPILYCKTHYAKANRKAIADAGRCVLVTSSSDASVTDAAWLPVNVVRWFTTNSETTDPRVEAIPIGFVYNAGRTKALVARAAQATVKTNLMYLNFTITSSPERIGLYERFACQPWVTTDGGASFSDVPPAAFYEAVASHEFILSPPGAGPDCHRTWEAMALGSIPIVKRSLATRILDDMPCLQVDDWSQVNPEDLVDILPILAERFTTPAMRKLALGYWRERMNACLNA